ncbi:hypothetical protein BSR29_07470 [Boudabousia liubingyangii]|uniref:DUF2273 domain-containing protein n=1 Tax=Boudabousia liubingyangii TaxID=1921764 RepID=A0A1Q5PKA8_9ACTO|nr:hypothetical protein [Boudabousia liubingyangii]OKL46647.1 hypothetical protein BSR29_07470 [Boudabousia liubingyangii]OKL46765.1 hypothetical protein BSR28_04800 [Boudabousia liubingyangii]
MRKSTELAILGAIIGVVIVVFHWWSLLIGLFAAIGYLAGRHLEGTLDFKAAWRALTGNVQTTSF